MSTAGLAHPWLSLFYVFIALPSLPTLPRRCCSFSLPRTLQENLVAQEKTTRGFLALASSVVTPDRMVLISLEVGGGVRV